MNKRFLIFFLLLLFINNLYAANKLKIAVLDLDAGVGLNQNQVDGLSNILSSELYNTGVFKVVERKKVHKVLTEQHFQASRISSAQRKKIGNILGVDAIVVGTINFIVRDRKLASDGSRGIDVGEYNIDIQLVSVDNGDFLSAAGGEQNYGSSERELMRQVARQLANNLDLSDFHTSSQQNSVQTLLGYLSVYPEDLGPYSANPYRAIDEINRHNTYGYNDWRLPTEEELETIKSNAYKIGMNSNRNYADDGSWHGTLYVRLVRSTKRPKPQEQRPSFNIDYYSWGTIPLLGGVVSTRFILNNPSSKDIEITNVKNTNSSISVDWTRSSISSGDSGYVDVQYNPKGRLGSNFKSSVTVILSNGQQFVLKVEGRVQ